MAQLLEKAKISHFNKLLDDSVMCSGLFLVPLSKSTEQNDFLDQCPMLFNANQYQSSKGIYLLKRQALALIKAISKNFQISALT